LIAIVSALFFVAAAPGVEGEDRWKDEAKQAQDASDVLDDIIRRTSYRNGYLDSAERTRA
jgi:hypothetical protein